MSSKASIYAAIFHDPPFFKHWALFVDDDNSNNTNAKRLFNAMGSECRFRYEAGTSDPRESDSLAELFYIADIDVAKVGEVEQKAENIPIRNDVNTWNCQDYVMDLLGALEDGAVVDSSDIGYGQRKKTLQGKIEGLV